MTKADATMFYGEPVTDDECLCDTHGCRLAHHYIIGWFCPECSSEVKEAEREELRAEWEQEIYEQECELDRGKCTVIRGPGFIGFSCTMPWWA